MKRSEIKCLRKYVFMMLMLLAFVCAGGCGKKEGLTTAQKEFVYVPEFHSIEIEGGGDQFQIVDNIIYFVEGAYDEAAGRYSQYLCMLPAGEDTVKRVPLELGEDSMISGLHADGEGNLRCMLQFSIREGSGQGEAGESEAEETEEISIAGESEEIAAATEAAIAVPVAGTEVIDAGGTEAELITYRQELCVLSTEGEILSRTDITPVFEGMEYVYINHMTSDHDGNLYIAMDQNLYLLDRDGKKQGEIALDEWPSGLFTARDGRVFLLHYQDTGMCLQHVDYQGKKLGEVVKEPMVDSYGNYMFRAGRETDLIYCKDNQLYTYQFGEAGPEEILTWTDCDIDSNQIQNFSQTEDGRILVLTVAYKENGSTLDVVTLTRKKGSEVEERKILTYGVLTLDQRVKDEIISFNKKNQEYRIEIREYMTDYTDGSYEDAVSQMNAEIMGGNGPDLIDLSNGNFYMYAAKGILEDFYPFIDRDPELKREDFLENILRAYEAEGCLYALPPSFTLGTAIVKSSHVNGKTSLTLDELMECMDRMPEGTSLYPYATKSSVLYYITCMNMAEYMDWNTGECRFNSEDFIRALEFSNGFPADFDQMEEEVSTPTLIREDRLLMLNNGINSVQEYQMYQGMFGEPISFVGYPTTKEHGSLITDNGMMTGISSRSSYKEGAWEFVRQSLTKAYQESEENFRMNDGFPVTKSGLEAMFARDMEEKYDELPDGTKERRPKTTWGYDDFDIKIYAATEEEISVVRELVTSIDTLFQYDEQVMTIINEETEAFFAGQKPAREVADIIQNRVEIYVNENR